MRSNMTLTSYKGLTEEELRNLPPEKLAKVAYDALQEYFKLQDRLNQDSTNSSLAPSTDSPEAKAKHKAEQKQHSKHGTRKQGAQPGHKAVVRPLLDLKEHDTVVDCKPEVCTHCGESLKDCTDPAPYRQQKYDFEIIRHITEYRRHELDCPCCGKSTKGTMPNAAYSSGYGSNVVMLTGVLTGLCRMSRRMTKMLLGELFGIPISVGTLSNLEEELTEASSLVMEEIGEVAQSAASGNADETGFGLTNGKQGWLWVLVTPIAVLFRVFVGRGQKWASELLGDFDGILTSDRWSGYNQYQSSKRQLCWAHLIRDFKAMCEQNSDGIAIGLGLRKEARLMFRCWHRWQNWKKQCPNTSMTSLESQMTPYRRRMLVLLEEGAKRGVCKCKTILKLEALLWTFTQVEGIEPTNNAAERAIRPAVLWKKQSFGVESERGARYVEAMLSIWATCRRNGVSTVSFLKDLATASRLNTPLPSIFPLISK